MERGPKGHGVDREELFVGQFQDHDLEEVAGPVGADHHELGWVGVGIDINDDHRMVGGVVDVDVSDPVPAGRLVNLHTSLS